MVKETVMKILKEEFEIENATMETNIREDLELDSIGILELIMALEEEFEMTVEDDKMDEIITIQDAVDYIEKALNHD